MVSFLLFCKVSHTKISTISTWAFKSFSISPTLMFTTLPRLKLSATPDYKKSFNWINERLKFPLSYALKDAHTFHLIVSHNSQNLSQVSRSSTGVGYFANWNCLVVPISSLFKDSCDSRKVKNQFLASPGTSSTEDRTLRISQIERIINWWNFICQIFSLNPISTWTQLVGAFPETSTLRSEILKTLTGTQENSQHFCDDSASAKNPFWR